MSSRAKAMSAKEAAQTGKKRNVGWLKKIGIVGFMFFLVKGIGWLVIIGLLAFGVVEEGAVQKLKDFFSF